jgi:protein-disulfide isomerase
MTEEQGKAILDELTQIRQLLDQQLRQAGANSPPAMLTQRAMIPLGSGPTLGREDSPITLVEFTDYQCPFCRDFHLTTFEQIKEKYIDTGKVRFISRDLPLDIHPHAMQAAQTARCAGEQGRYWEVRHTLIVNASTLSPDLFVRFAKDLNLDTAKFQTCLQSDMQQKAVEEDMAAARAVAITGTPTFVLGPTTNGTVDGLMIIGAQPFEVFDSKIKELLAAAPSP